MKRYFYPLLFIIILFCSCNQNKIKEIDVSQNKKEIQLSETATNKFKECLIDIPIYGKKYNVKSCFHIYSNLLPGFYSNIDTIDYLYFRLETDSNDLFIAAHKNFHYLIINIPYDSKYYLQDESVFFPIDLNFLNKETGLFDFNITGSNTDKENWRRVSYDKRLIDSWILDSTSKDKKMSSFSSSKLWIIKEDSIYVDGKEYSYKLNGDALLLYSESGIDTFKRVTISSTNLYLGYYYQNEFQHLFFSRSHKGF